MDLIRKNAMAAVVVAVATAGCVSASAHQATLDQLKQAQAAQQGCGAELERLKADSARSAQACAAARKQLDQLGQSLKASSEELEELRKQRAETERQLAAFKSLTARFQKMIDTGALRVRIRGGRMIVEMPAGVLFPSGKADLSPRGLTTLQTVAGVLKDLKQRRFIVAGHTDNVPISKAQGTEHGDNWGLSTARALTVTRFLIASGMAPRTLAAAGYSEYDPVASNRSARGKQQNRRIEIILVPILPGLNLTPDH